MTPAEINDKTSTRPLACPRSRHARVAVDEGVSELPSSTRGICLERAEKDQGKCRAHAAEPSAGHSDIDDWFGLLVPHLQPTVKGLDESIRAVVPGLHYAVKWKRAFYGLPGLGWIIEIAPYDVSANVVFLGGADFDPPPPLGTTDRTRYVKVTTLGQALRPELHEWIEQAGSTPGWQ